MEGLAREVMARIEPLVPEPSNRWLFGEKPTALDTHLVVFIARMRDVGRSGLIPERSSAWADWAMQGREWVGLMDGRKTMK